MHAGTPVRVDKPSGKTISMMAKRWHVLEVLALSEQWDTVVEIGVFRGWTFFHLLKHCPQLNVIGVDPYQQPEGKGAEVYDADLSVLHRQVLARAAEFGPRATLIRVNSLAAAEQCRGRHFNAVFIDGDHRTNHVVSDIKAWKERVRPGGWLLGHDYHHESVKAAVGLTLPKPVLFPDNVFGVRL